jgi:GNAT superfamily N-acetyltransferase
MRIVLQAWADNAVEFARVLGRQDAAWGAETFDLAGGRVALCGPGMWINGAYAVGLDVPITEDELTGFEQRCAAIGLPASIEVSPLTRDDVVTLLGARGYAVGKTVSALRRGFDDVDALLPTDPAIVIEPAGGQVATWQETAALGWGHPPDARRASDAFSRAASVVDGDGFVLARARDDRRPLGCASLTIRGTVATLGGMSTLPQERRRGVQSALIRHRLHASAMAGCEIAVSTTAPGSDSERNLIRHGFEPWFELTTWTLTTSHADR